MIVEFLFNDALLLDYFVTFYRTYVVVFSTFEVHIRFWKLIFIILMQEYVLIANIHKSVLFLSSSK